MTGFTGLTETIQPDNSDRAIQDLERLVQAGRRRRWLLFPLAAAVWLFFALHDGTWNTFQMLIGFTLVIAVCWLSGITDVRAKTDWSEIAPGAIPKLVELLVVGDPSLQDAASRALVQCLPRIRTCERQLLTERQRAILYRQIRGSNTPLILAILKALEQVGDEKAVPFVQERLDGTYYGGNARQIRAAAQECMIYLTARVQRNAASSTLLRAAELSASDTDVLLRPAAGASTYTNHLLMPVESLPDTDHDQQPVQLDR